MKKVLIPILILIALIAIGVFINNSKPTEEELALQGLPVVSPIEHASFVMQWGDLTIYNDPVGAPEFYSEYESPDLILISDIHGDHLSTTTLTALATSDTVLVAPQAVADMLTPELLAKTVVLANEESTNQLGIEIEAYPMYNLPEAEDAYHTKGRGNGYLLEKDDVRVYIAGDTGPIEEIRDLEDIDIVFIPMNLPYTMTVRDASRVILDMEPKVVYPYHYRGQVRFGDVNEFKERINKSNHEITVVLADWYPNKEEVDKDADIVFAYPDEVSGTYVKAQSWPPSLESIDEKFSCATTENKNGTIEEREIGGRTFCITTGLEGAAGTTYKHYEYAFAHQGKTAVVSFTLAFPQCANFESQSKINCEKEQEGFDPDTLFQISNAPKAIE